MGEGDTTVGASVSVGTGVSVGDGVSSITGVGVGEDGTAIGVTVGGRDVGKGVVCAVGRVTG